MERERLQELETFWEANPSYWFGATPEVDALLTHKYESLLDAPLTDALFSHLLLYDQIARHVRRHRGYPEEWHQPYFTRALRLAESLRESGEGLSALTPFQQVFTLLVFRHTKDPETVLWVIETLRGWRRVAGHPLYKRFYQASLRAYARLPGIAASPAPILEEITDEAIQGILDADRSPPWAPDPISSLPLHPKLQGYASEVGRILEKKRADTGATVIISLSGGVDSMVTLYLAHHAGLQPVALSIHYANRPEQAIEMEMVRRYCASLGVPHFVREIHEIKRESEEGQGHGFDREFYEEYTREVRFLAYQSFPNPIVLLGHNKDDSLENVITNIKKKQSYENLFGMEVHGEERGVKTCRPLLHLQLWKREIIEIAQEAKIPFVYDSTPAWSERGKMRDHLFPYLNVFDPRILEGLASLAGELREVYHIYQTSAIPEIKEEGYHLTCVDKGIYFEDYLKRIIHGICRKYHLPAVRNTAIKHLHEFLTRRPHPTSTVTTPPHGERCNSLGEAPRELTTPPHGERCNSLGEAPRELTTPPHQGALQPSTPPLGESRRLTLSPNLTFQKREGQFHFTLQPPPIH